MRGRHAGGWGWVAALVIITLGWVAAARAEAEPPEPVGGAMVEAVLAPFTGDLPALRERRVIRILTAWSPTHYSIVDGHAQGLVAEMAAEFETYVNATLEGPFVSVVVLAAPRAKLVDWLLAGHGDIAAANLTVTPERQARVVFSEPLLRNVVEQVVLGPTAPEVLSLDDVADAGVVLHVRPGSSYAEHLDALNAARSATGATPLQVALVDPEMLDEDVLELVAAGSFPATVIDDHKLAPWLTVLPELRAPAGVVVNEGGTIALALRPDNPQLLELVNGFVPKVRRGTLLGNMALQKYLGSGERLRNALDDEHGRRLAAIIEYIQRSADAHGFDWMLLGAQGFQESRLDPTARSERGAVGVMQVLPSTAREPYIGLADIDDPAVNVEAGARYDRWVIDTFLDDPAIGEVDRMLFALAAYNAGPGNLQKARRRAAELNLDPNVWFDNVEVAMAKTVSNEPVVYVRNIYKYYAAYRLYADQVLARRQAAGG